jgi:hypothetical protein
MKLPVRIREEAEVDLADAAIWYGSSELAWGKNFWIEL